MQRNLTEDEITAVDAPVNVADGHARQSLTDTQRDIVARMSSLFHEAERTPLCELESDAHQALFGATGQLTAPSGSARVLTAYASSVAMDILARCLGERGSTTALVHPTFDNIPDLLRSRGVPLLALEEDRIQQAELPAALRAGDCVFLTVPNNPTGAILAPALLREIADACRRRGLVLALDTCFRGFDTRMWFDQYELLDKSGVEYVVIEDTGKLWPIHELKLGLLVHSPDIGLPLHKAYSDLLLSASPFIMRLVAELARDASNGGFQTLHALIAENRRVLTEALAGADAVLDSVPDARVSVMLVQVPRDSAPELQARLRSGGVHVLAGGAFFWADRSRGDSLIRVALARDPDIVEEAARALRSALSARRELAAR